MLWGKRFTLIVIPILFLTLAPWCLLQQDWAMWILCPSVIIGLISIVWPSRGLAQNELFCDCYERPLALKVMALFLVLLLVGIVAVLLLLLSQHVSTSALITSSYYLIDIAPAVIVLSIMFLPLALFLACHRSCDWSDK